MFTPEERYRDLIEQPWVLDWCGYALLYDSRQLPADAILRKSAAQRYLVIDFSWSFAKNGTNHLWVFDSLRDATSHLTRVGHSLGTPTFTPPSRQARIPEQPLTRTALPEFIKALLRHRKSRE